MTQTSRVVLPLPSAVSPPDPQAATADIIAATPIAAESLRFTPFLPRGLNGVDHLPRAWPRPFGVSTGRGQAVPSVTGTTSELLSPTFGGTCQDVVRERDGGAGDGSWTRVGEARHGEPRGGRQRQRGHADRARAQVLPAQAAPAGD